MSRQDLVRKAEKSAAKIAKIEPMNPETMLYGAVKDELLMRLHDAELVHGVNLAFNTATAFSKAQRAVIEADLHEGYKAAEQYIKELPNFENAERTKALWLELIRRKNDPAYCSLVKVEQFELVESEVVDEFGMSQSDVERLTQLEFAIEKGLELMDKGRTLAGDSLKEIRDKKLYKAYGTFEAYCEQKCGFSRSRAYQFIGEAEIVNNLLTSGVEPDELPQNEGQTRALAGVPVDKQAEVWTQVKSEGKPTAAKIKAIAKASVVGDDSEIPPNPPCKGGQREDEWNPNLWETPDNIANAIANLLCDGLSICEPVAGTGQIARAIVSHFEEKGWEYELTAIEILKDRAAKLEDNRYFSIDADFLEFDFGSEKFDVVVTNPPFDKGLDILKKSLSLLNISGRCLFLLPIAYFQTQERAKQFAGMGAYIHRVYPIVGRVAYLKNGIPESGRQCEDAVFDIRLGKDDACMEFIWQ